jgi:serine protease Do
VALSIENTVNKGLTFGDIGVELAKAGNIDRALEVAHSIPDKTECADCNHYALRYIAEALAKAGNLDLALDVVRSLENITDKVWVLQDIAAVVAEAGNAQAIEKILKETRQVAHSIEAGEPEVSNKVWALRFRGTVLAKAGNVQEGERILKQALEVARSIEDPAHRDTALWNIATAFIEAGRIEHALDLVRALESIESHASSKAWSLRNIAGALAEVGNIQQAENVLKQALEMADSIDETIPRSQARRGIVEVLAEAGKIEQALDIAHSIEEKLHRDSALSDIASELANRGHIDRALDIACSLKETENALLSNESKARALRDIAVTLVNTDDVNRSLDVAQTIKQSDSRRRAFMTLTLNALFVAVDDSQQEELARKIMTAFDQEKNGCGQRTP